MSHRADNYLSLCLEQATKSPLHYRHGCIVVRGGKVIGQGFNDYRNGFSGGALKSGRLANSGSEQQLVREVKAKMKPKLELHHDTKPHSVNATFTPFEAPHHGAGGGHLMNTPLSMHSEMMAIYSALNASSTFASSAFSSEKPCFKLPRHSKRKNRLRRERLEAYVERACNDAAATQIVEQQIHRSTDCCGGKSQVKLDRKDNRNAEDKDRGDQMVAAGPTWKSGVKDRMNKKSRHVHHGEQYDRSGHQTQQEYQQQSAYDSCSSRSECSIVTSTPSPDVPCRTGSDTRATASKVGLKTSPRRKSRVETDLPRAQPLLVPKCRANRFACSVRDRMKHPRLNGADLYVVRIGRSETRKDITSSRTPETANQVRLERQECNPSPSSPCAPFACASLHDELLFPDPKSPSQSSCSKLGGSAQDGVALSMPVVHASRPCYRCIAYMHAVGIKRVFWTNDKGEWESGKVGAMADALDGGDETSDCLTGNELGANGGIFVTKHEVLMLRRVMDANMAGNTSGKRVGRGK